MKPVRLGFIGLGLIPTSAHLPGLAPLVESGDVVLQAFCDVDEETLQKQAAAFKPRTTYGNHREMLEKEELDAIYFCVPPTFHTDELEMAADKGLAVFIEKPVTLDMSKAVANNAIVEKAGILTQVGFLARYEPAAPVARELLHEHTLRHANLLAIRNGQPLRYWTSRYDLSGGSFVENTIHRIDLLRYLVDDDIEQISAFYMPRQPGEGPEPMNLPHVYNVNYRFASGITANATTSRVQYESGIGKNDMYLISDEHLLEYHPDRLVENGKVVWETDEKVNGFARQAEAFIRAVQDDDHDVMRSSYADALNSLAAVLGANLSAENGGQVVDAADLVSGRVNYVPEEFPLEA
jgi:predicted dehydrogenase